MLLSSEMLPDNTIQPTGTESTTETYMIFQCWEGRDASLELEEDGRRGLLWLENNEA